MPIRWGIVSAGKISHDFVNAINSFPDKGDQLIVSAVAARDKQRATEFANLHKIPKVFDNYQALAESNDIDVAYVGALNPEHYKITQLFLENGKHVLCEKPLCLNFKQAQSLLNLAGKKKLFLMEAVWSRFAPAYLALEEEINKGKLGDIKHVEVNFGVPIERIDRVTYPFHIPETLIHVDGVSEQFTLHTSKIPYNFGNSAGLVYQALEVSRCIREGLLESPRMTHSESLTLAKLEDTVRKQLGVHYDVDDQEFP